MCQEHLSSDPDMTELADLVEAYKREVSIPGAFATDFPTVTDEAIQGALGDAFAEAQIDGFFGKMQLDTDDWVITPDLSTAGAALVVSYAGIRVLRQQILAQARGTTYKAPGLEYTVTPSASVLSELLRQLLARRDAILGNAHRGGTSVFVLDGYERRGNSFYGGLFNYEIPLPRWAD